MTPDDAVWIFTGIIFTVLIGCIVWVIREERRKK